MRYLRLMCVATAAMLAMLAIAACKSDGPQDADRSTTTEQREPDTIDQVNRDIQKQAGAPRR